MQLEKHPMEKKSIPTTKQPFMFMQGHDNLFGEKRIVPWQPFLRFVRDTWGELATLFFETTMI